MGGFYSLVEGMVAVCKLQGVTFHPDANVTQINITKKQVTSLSVNGNQFNVDGIVGSADYHHIEQKLLPKEYKNYSEDY
jgi:phytoene desaturase